MPLDFALRLATPGDAPAITTLIERSVHGLQADDYSQEQRQAAIGQVFLVDHGLIADGTYLVAELDGARIVGAGGWSDRRALHGGQVHDDAGERIEPRCEPARIRAYFVDPDYSRRGIGSAILNACERAAAAAHFTRAKLGATLTGVPFYARHGYEEKAREESPLPGGGSLTVVHMSRRLVGPALR